jgi:hypothetical protein
MRAVGNMTAVWHLNATDALADSTGNGNDASAVSSPTNGTGAVGGGVTFNGTSSYLTMGANTLINTGTPHTLQVWAKLTDFAQYYPGVVWLKANSAMWGLSLSDAGGYLDVLVGAPTVWARRRGYRTGGFPTGAFHHIAATYNGSGAGTGTNFQIYYDGTAMTMADADPYSAGAAVNRIAASYDNWFFKGTLDEIRVAAAARSANYLSTDYNCQASTTLVTAGTPVSVGRLRVLQNTLQSTLQQTI